jgi:hypothetical protein
MCVIHKFDMFCIKILEAFKETQMSFVVYEHLVYHLYSLRKIF